MTLRRRCADALAFLEITCLVKVSEDDARNVSLTDIGRRHLQKAFRDKGDLGLLVRQLRTNHERAKARGGYQ